MSLCPSPYAPHPYAPQVKEAYASVDRAATALCEAVRDDFALPFAEGGDNGADAMGYDVANNILVLKRLPKMKEMKEMKVGGGVNEGNVAKQGEEGPEAARPEGAGIVYVTPRDRNNKLMKGRYTTDRVQDALADYIEVRLRVV